MAAAHGYIGRSPSDSSTVIARQSFSPTGIQTDFTFAAGYEVGYVDLYLNGARLVEGQDFTATDGSTVGLTTNAVNGDVLEVVAFKAFNAANVTASGGNFAVSQNLTVTGVSTFTGAITATGGVVGDATGLSGTPDITVRHLKATGISTVSDTTQSTTTTSGALIVSGGLGIAKNLFVGGSMNVAGTLTYEDVTNSETAGITTTGGLVVTGLGATFGSGVGIADSIYHLGDDNTAIRFPAADTITAETNGSERLRIASNGHIGINTNDPKTRFHIHQSKVANAPARTAALYLENNANCEIQMVGNASNDCQVRFGIGGNSFKGAIEYQLDNDALLAYVDGSERLRVDSGGRLLLGTTSDTAPGGFNAKIQTASTSFDGSISLRRDSNNTGAQSLVFGKSRGSLNGNTIVQDGDTLGTIDFYGADGTDLNTAAAQILAAVDGSPGSNDMPGRIVFSTTADGASSVTERARIDSSGRLLLGTDSAVTAVPSGESDAPGLQISKANKPTSIALYRNDTSIASGNTLGGVHWYGNDTTSNTPAVLASMQVQADSDHAAGDNPTRITFSNTADGSASPTERLRIDSSGKLLINTTSVIGGGANALLHLVAASGPEILFGRNDSTTAAGNDIGKIRFFGNDGGSYQETATISAQADLDHANNDKPGRLVFSTTADGASSVTERLRITSGGLFNFNSANNNNLMGRVTIFDGDDFSTASQPGIKDNIYLISDATSGDNVYGASIAFSRVQYQDRRAAAIAAVQTTSDEDQVGLAFFTHSSTDAAAAIQESVRIEHNGYMLIGTTTATGNTDRLLQVGDTSRSSTYIEVRTSTSGASGVVFSDDDDGSGSTGYRGTIEYAHSADRLDFKTAGVTRLTCDSSGNFTATGNVTAYSDVTLKENIETIPNALDKVLNLRGVEFDRNDKENNPHEIGVIAQEVEEVVPEVVMTNEEGLKSVAYGNLVGLLIESIKELKAEVNDLKAQLEG